MMISILQLQSALGLLVFPLLAILLRERNQLSGFLSKQSAKTWFLAVILQLLLALMLIKLPPFQSVFTLLNSAVLTLQEATTAGTSFVFGYLGGANLPFVESTPGSAFIIAFRVLPLIIVIGAITALLSYWRILPWIISSLSKMFVRTLNIGGAVALAGAANIFVGMTEAPLFIRDSINKLSRSELFMVMTLGMSTVAGTVLILYATFLSSVIDNAIGHILTASIISVPAAVMIAALMVPSNSQPTTGQDNIEFDYSGSVDAITQGSMNAMQMMISIIALLISFIAMIFLCNAALELLPAVAGEPLSLERILGWIMAPVCWLMGIPWAEATTAGSLMGVKTVLNELIAYIQLSELPKESLSARSDLIISYALCGFANFGSLGILIGGLSTLAPERRADITDLGMRSIVSGTLATCMTASIVGVITF